MFRTRKSGSPEGKKTSFEKGDAFDDRYRIERLLGKGGMGAVYLTQDEREDRTVALKILLPAYTKNKVAIERFRREVETMSRLDHPLVATIYDFGTAHGTSYYTMEYVSGKTLESVLEKHKTLTTRSAVRVAYEVTEALEHVHKHVIHRDVSPANVMITKEGRVKLLDFGVAKFTDQKSALTMVGVHIGKLLYSAPEQRQGDPSIDHRADIYPIGVMLYQMLTGELEGAMMMPSKLVAGLPEDCAEFITHSTAVDPDDRYATAAEAKAALKQIYRRYDRKSEDATPESGE